MRGAGLRTASRQGPIINGATNVAPALVHSVTGALEMVIALAGGGFAHYRASLASGGAPVWQLIATVATDRVFQNVVMIQNLTDPGKGCYGNLELLGVVSGGLQHFSASGDNWSGADIISVSIDGGPVQPLTGLGGAPGFVQQTDGTFVVAAPMGPTNGFAWLTRSTQASGYTWSFLGHYGVANFDAISLMYDVTTGHVEGVGRTGPELYQIWLSPTEGWSWPSALQLA